MHLICRLSAGWVRLKDMAARVKFPCETRGSEMAQLSQFHSGTSFWSSTDPGPKEVERSRG
jgi:hypothetical protein